MPRTNTAIVKLFGNTEQTATEDHCAICDDGGYVVPCRNCKLFFCFQFEKDGDGLNGGSEDEDFDDPACVTLPTYYDRNSVPFYCPDCLSIMPDRAIEYKINRGHRTTQRRVARAQVNMIVNYLPRLEATARSFLEPAMSTLGGFHVIGESYYLPLPNTLSKRDLRTIERCESPYHLVFVLFTEGSAGGGWAWSDVQSSEDDMINNLLEPYDGIARKAVTARIFVLACGLNLRATGVIAKMANAFASHPWESMLVPTVPAIYPNEIAVIFPQLFVHLFYLGTSLCSTLVRVWGASRRASIHTNWIVFEQPIDRTGPRLQPASADPRSGESNMMTNGQLVSPQQDTPPQEVPRQETPQQETSIVRYSYSSETTRPFGYLLPLPSYMCSCVEDKPGNTERRTIKRWVRQGGISEERHGEFFVRHRLSCSHVYFRMAVCLQGATLSSAAGVQIIKEPFDHASGEFPLDSEDARHVEFHKVSRASDRTTFKSRDHTEPWTKRGQALQRSTH